MLIDEIIQEKELEVKYLFLSVRGISPLSVFPPYTSTHASSLFLIGPVPKHYQKYL